MYTSYWFVAFFLVIFALYYILPKKIQWIILLAASIGFYLYEMRLYALVLPFMSLIIYITARRIEIIRNADLPYNEHNDTKKHELIIRKKCRRVLIAGMIISFLLLVFFKYTIFILDNINQVIWKFDLGRGIVVPEILLPVGISFYTLQAAGYLLDVYWEREKAQKNYGKLLLFLSFFPQLAQGPISRYSDLKKSLFVCHGWDGKMVSFGFERILWGLFKKLVIADYIRTLVTDFSSYADTGDYSGIYVLVVLLAYSVQLYADFTGGIDMTIGMAEVFGIRLKENFCRPFFSKSITEYWRRWHISMGTWFRDYVFYPMSISSSMRKVTKRCKKLFGKNIARKIPVWIVTIVTWFATGLWHGARWYFVVWGLLNGVIIIISETLTPLYRRFHAAFPVLGSSGGYRIFQIVRTFLLMGSLRLFDCYQSVSLTFGMFIGMFRDFNPMKFEVDRFVDAGITPVGCAVLIFGVLLMFVVSMAERKSGTPEEQASAVREYLYKKPWIVRCLVYIALAELILLFGQYGVGFDKASFIYNQF